MFRAVDEETSTEVAVKILKQGVSEDPQYAVRLWREAQSLRALWGASVVQAYGFWTDPAGFVFMVMEYLDGETLEDHLIELEGFGDRTSAFEVLRILDPIARALHDAHGKGIIHRDIKPANIFLVHPDAGGGTRLMDFGLAKIEGTEQLTQVGMIAGSPSYIAPELWRSEPFDHRIDVYSLGAVVFRALAGRPPFYAAATLDIFVKATKDPRPKLSPERPDLPVEIDGWIERALSIESQARYPSIPAMWNDLIALVMRSSSPSGELARAAFSVPA